MKYLQDLLKTEDMGYGTLIKKYYLNWEHSVHLMHDNRLPKLAYFITPKDVEMWENPGVDGKTSFNTSEQWNGFIA